MKICMYKSSFLKQLGSVRSRLSKLCDIRTTLCAVSKPHLHTVLTLLVVMQTFLGSVSVQERCVYANCNCNVISIMRARSQHCFQRERRWCRCKHLELSAPLITIKVLQNRSGLHSTVSLTIDTSRLDHWIASCFRSLHSCHDTHFFQRVQLLLSSLLHFCEIVKACQDFRLPGMTSPAILFPHRSRR